MVPAPSAKYLVLALWLSTILYVQLRGHVRHKLKRLAAVRGRVAVPRAAKGHGAMGDDPRRSAEAVRRGLHPCGGESQRHRLQHILPHRLEAVLSEMVRRLPAVRRC